MGAGAVLNSQKSNNNCECFVEFLVCHTNDTRKTHTTRERERERTTQWDQLHMRLHIGKGRRKRSRQNKDANMIQKRNSKSAGTKRETRKAFCKFVDLPKKQDSHN